MISDFNTLVLLITKLFAVLGTVIYFIFAVIIVKQVNMMTKNVSDIFNPILIAFSYLHFLFSLFLILLTILIL